MVAINSAIEVDIAGQVCSDSVGRVHSGICGQVHFLRGAARSKEGMPIIAFARHGQRRGHFADRASAAAGGGCGDLARRRAFS
jgi:hypothetical protein